MSKDNNTLKLFVAIPSGDEWHRLFGLSLAMMVGDLSSGLKVGHYTSIQVKIDNHRGSILSRSREKLANLAMAWQATHILYVDSDMVFPAELARRLLAHKKWVVACNCPTKMIPATTTARQEKAGLRGGEQVFSDPDRHGLEKVWRVGTGVMLIDARAFLKVPKPWFPITYIPEIDDYEGEDWGFVKKLREAGVATYVDHDTSRMIGHCGSFVYTHDVVGQIVQEEVPAEEEGAHAPVV